MEYERYLEENLHCWQQQLQEKTEASHKKVQPQLYQTHWLKKYLLMLNFFPHFVTTKKT